MLGVMPAPPAKDRPLVGGCLKLGFGQHRSDSLLILVFEFTRIDRDAAPRFLTAEEPEFDKTLTYLREVTKTANLPTRYAADGDLIRPAPAC